ncbi:hypothetical protein J2S19_001576 [Metabacillus malikii]|uniref:N-acetyltransferase domain-containing protein n=2 Tax=Metabacillus malikii TaxID=1504265 RepID=A0ABT9ZDI7_9BACI|nr:hypothetical protein [Metabacillus malikii]
MQVIRCDHDEEKERMIDFILAHRKEINPAYDVRTVFFSLGTQLLYGDTLLVLNNENELIGFVGYLFGTPENQFQDPETVRIEMVYLKNNYRCTRHFIACFRKLLTHIEEANLDTIKIQFYVNKENDYLCKLSSKFAIVESTTLSNFGEELLYSTSLTEVKTYLENIAGVTV